MPTYDYRCLKCGEDLEVYQSFSDKPLSKHDSCGGKLVKVLSPAGIVLKGSGFYKTDNRVSSKAASKERASENGNGSSESSNASTSSGSSESKSGSSKSESSKGDGAKPGTGSTSSEAKTA